MGDLLLYRMDSYSIGEAVITYNSSLGVVVNPKTKIYKKKSLSVFYHELGGTAFVYKVCEPPIEILYSTQNRLKGFGKAEKEFIIGFALTAAHTIINPVSKMFRQIGLKARSLNCSTKINLIPFKNLCSEFPNELFSSEGIKYMLPGDLCILAILSTKHIDLVEIPCAGSVEIENCYTIGFPSMPINSPLNFYPYTDDEFLAYQKLSQIFFDGGKLIKSNGSVISYSELIQITCSAMCGMSGSPIISKNGLIGMLIGGPVLPGQRELLICAELVFNGSYIEAWEYLGQLQSLNTEYNKPIFEKLIKKGKNRSMFAELIVKSGGSIPGELADAIPNNQSSTDLEQIKLGVIGILIKFINCCLRFRGKKENYSNTGISIKSEIFRYVDETIQEFLISLQGGVEFDKIGDSEIVNLV